MFVTSETARRLNCTFLDKDDLLIARMPDPLGRACIFPGVGQPAITAVDVFVWRPSPDGVLAKWLMFFVNSSDVRSRMAEQAGGTTRQRIAGGRVKQLEIPVPPLPEQRRIVTKIDSLSAKSRRSRDHLDHIPRLVEKYEQAILAAAFTGSLTRDWRAKHRADNRSPYRRERVQAERDAMRTQAGLRAKGRNRNVPAKVVDLPQLPAGWEWLTFDDCAWDLTVGHVGPMKDRYVSAGIAFLRSLNVRPNRVDLSNVVYIDEQFDRELTKSKLRPGDLIVVRTGDPGVAAVVPPELKTANCSDLVICRLVQSMSPSYAAFYMNSEFAKGTVRNFQVGVAQQHLTVMSAR